MTSNQVAKLPIHLSTEELSCILKVKAQSIRAGLCRDGHYMGLRPVKLANRRLLWDAAQADRLTTCEVAK